MAKRKLIRQLNLMQVIMLGAAGTISTEIFVLTGHAAGLAGPGAVLALIIAGILTLPIAINYCELATTYPVTGGAMAYVGEAFGKSLFMFLVGSLDCLSSGFYAALSAVGFAYSLQIFFPFLPLLPVAFAVIILMGFMHMRGVTQAGNVQVVLGAFLIIVFSIYIYLGFTSPQGFNWPTFNSGNVVFEGRSLFGMIGLMMGTIALVYNAYVGFEVIADDAEEITQPTRNIPLGILLSLGITTVVYVTVAIVTIGTVPYNQVAGSSTALTDAARFFWPGVGVTVLGIAGLVATLTSVNSAMLSATREAFTLSREHVWPRVFSRLSQWRTPYAAILFIAAFSCFVALLGAVDFLSYIASAGYMFVLFFTSLAMLRLHKLHPNIERPWKAPFFPLTAYMGVGAGALIVAFAAPRALLFLSILLVVLSAAYLLSQAAVKKSTTRAVTAELRGGERILVSASTTPTAIHLARLAARLAEHQEDTSICLFNVVKAQPGTPEAILHPLEEAKRALQKDMLRAAAPYAIKRNVPIYTKFKVAPDVESGIFQ